MKNKKSISIVALLICAVFALTSCASLSDLSGMMSSEESLESSLISEEEKSEESNAQDEYSKEESQEGSLAEESSVEESQEGSSAEESKDESSNTSEAEDVFNEVSKDPYEGNSAGNYIADLYDYCIESCVSIVCKVVTQSQGIWGQPTSYEGTSLGSGFVIEGGYIVTNHHVIDDAKEIKVVFNDGDEVKAELVGSDATYDIAVLKVKTSKKLSPVKIGDSSAIRIGEEVIAIGTPSSIEFAGSLTYGVISGLNRKVDVKDDNGRLSRTMYLIQTDATLNPGNSGGPLFNMKGEVIGINNMKLVSSYEGIGFSIPINGAMEVIKSFINGEELPDIDYASTKGYLGIQGEAVSDVRKKYSLSNNVPDGVLVVYIESGSSSYKAGLSYFDVITKFQDVKIKNVDELKAELAKYKAGKEVTIEVYRPSRDGKSGETLTITFKLDKAD